MLDSGRILDPLVAASSSSTSFGIAVKLIESNKNDKNPLSLLNEILSVFKGASPIGKPANNFNNNNNNNNGLKRIGVLPQKGVDLLRLSGLSGLLYRSLTSGPNSSAYECVDMSVGVGSVLCVHDSVARQCLVTAADLSTRVMKKYLIEEMESIIDEEKTVSQLQLADSTEDKIREPASIGAPHVKAEDVDACYTPIIQSGGVGEASQFDLRPSAQTLESPLIYAPTTSILVQLGVRFKNLCSNIGRTYFINPTQEQKDIYNLLTQVYLAAKQAMKPGQKIQNIMSAAHLR